MRWIPLGVLLMAGCDAVPVFWIDARQNTTHRGSFDRIERACEFWGIACEESGDDRGALSILLTDHGGEGSDGLPHAGEAIDHTPCSPFVWAVDDELALEHEIGHALGLRRHRDDPANVMYFDVDDRGDYVTEFQLDVVALAADRLVSCPG